MPPIAAPSPTPSDGLAVKPVVLGATGRLGRMLRAHWGPDGAIWQARTPRPGHVTCDLGDAAALSTLLSGAQTVVMLAGVVPDGIVQDGNTPLEANVTLTQAVMEAARPGARVLLASSAAVYGRGPTQEDTAPAPLSPYGRAMARREATATRIGAARGVSVCALRIGNVAGADACLGGWRPGFTLDRFADGSTPRRSYIGPQTLAHILATLVRTPPDTAALNVAAPGVVAMGDLLKNAGLDYQTRPAPPAALAEVHLDPVRLSQHVTLDPEAGSAARLVAEWRAWKATP